MSDTKRLIFILTIEYFKELLTWRKKCKIPIPIERAKWIGNGDGRVPGDTDGGILDPEQRASTPFNTVPAYVSMQYLTLVIALLAVLCGVVLTALCVGVGLICYRRKKIQLKRKYESSKYSASPGGRRQGAYVPMITL